MVMMSKEEGERQEVASESVRSGKVVKKRKRRKRRRKSLKLKEKEEDVPKIHKNKSIFSKTFDLDAYQRQLDEKINNHLDSVSVSSEEDNPHEGLSRKVNEEDRLSDDADFERLSND